MSEFAATMDMQTPAGQGMARARTAIGAERFRALTERLKRPSALSARLSGQTLTVEKTAASEPPIEGFAPPSAPGPDPAPERVAGLVPEPDPLIAAADDAFPESAEPRASEDVLPKASPAPKKVARPLKPDQELDAVPLDWLQVPATSPDDLPSDPFLQSKSEDVAEPVASEYSDWLQVPATSPNDLPSDPFLQSKSEDEAEPVASESIKQWTPDSFFADLESKSAEPATTVPDNLLQRRISGLWASDATCKASPASTLSLPEILPPPAPPPPPPELEVVAPSVTAPSMEEVQQRLREDATARLEQLDLENIWRLVLANPTHEERAQYLSEAAEFEALKVPAEIFASQIPPELDLSLVKPQTPLPPAKPHPESDRVSASEVESIEAMMPMDTNSAPTILYSQDPLPETLSEDDAETAELARSLLDMMASGTNSGLPHERALASDTLLRLLPKLALKPLMMMAERLAMMEAPPHLIVGRLIRDPRPEVSGPLLENCMAISEQDLLNVVADENPAKRRLLARRRRLSSTISKALIETRDPAVLLTLVRNAQAEISHEGFAELIECAGAMPEILAPLSTRADLSAPFAFELFWKSPSQLRRFLLSRFLTDSETLTKILKITLATHNEDGPEACALSTTEMVETLSRACKGKIESSAEKIAEAIQVSSGCIQRILMDRGGEPLVVMLKVAGFPRGTLPDVLRAATRGDIPLIAADRDLSELQVMFDTLSYNKARILITYWDWAVRKSGPYAPLN